MKQFWKHDLLSGFLVSLIALPLCLGIAGASNFPPIMGVLTAIVGGLIVSLFAGSELTIKGPAAGLIVICAGAVDELGKGDLIVGWHLTLGVVAIAGLLQFILGKLKVASLADFFPLSAVHGMLAAIGIIIMSKQLHLAVGILPSELKGKEPLDLLMMVPHSIMNMEWHIAAIGGVSLIILFGWKYIGRGFLAKVPPALVVLIVAVLMGQYFHLTDLAYQARKPLVNPGEFKIDFNVDFSAMTNPDLLPIFLKYLLMFTLIGSLESLLTGRAIDLLDPNKKKSDLSSCLKLWYENRIKALRLTSNGEELRHIFLNTDMGESTSNAIIDFLSGVGITLTTTCPHTPEQNMIIERVWRTIGESAIAMMLTASLSEMYWEEARKTACYMYNRSPSTYEVNLTTSPYESYFGTVPSVSHLKIFGSTCYPVNLTKAKGNHEPKAWPGIFVGYQD